MHRLKKDLEALEILIEGKVPPRRRPRSMRQVVAYLMRDSSGLGFGLIMWSQIRLLLESGEFNPIYQMTYSNFTEGENLTERI